MFVFHGVNGSLLKTRKNLWNRDSVHVVIESSLIMPSAKAAKIDNRSLCKKTGHIQKDMPIYGDAPGGAVVMSRFYKNLSEIRTLSVKDSVHIYYCLITNLCQGDFSTAELKKAYDRIIFHA